jgi:hypothetical protein
MPQEMIKEKNTNADAKIPADFFVNDLFKRLININPSSGKTGINQASCNMRIFYCAGKSIIKSEKGKPHSS